MGSVLLQWERVGKKQGEKKSRKERSLNLSFFFFLLFLRAVVFSCISLIQIPASKRVPIILVLLRPTGETGALLEALPTAVPGPLQMFASCCSGPMQGRQLMQPRSAGLQCSAEGAGNATVTNDLLIM